MYATESCYEHKVLCRKEKEVIQHMSLRGVSRVAPRTAKGRPIHQLTSADDFLLHPPLSDNSEEEGQTVDDWDGKRQLWHVMLATIILNQEKGGFGSAAAEWRLPGQLEEGFSTHRLCQSGERTKRSP